MNTEYKISAPEIPPGGNWTITQEDLQKIETQNEALIEIRGRVISSSLNNEHKLDNIIALIFMGEDLNAINFFKELLLEKEFFTFMNKWKLFKELTHRKVINFENEGDRINVLGGIKKIIQTRDCFAHGEIVFLGTLPQLIYLDEGKKKRIDLDNKYFDQQNMTFAQIDNALQGIFNFLCNLKNKGD
jgi:hypothetical protein